MVLRALLFCLLCSGCLDDQRSATVSLDTWTQVTRVISPEVEVFRDPRGIMTVRTALFHDDGQVNYGVMTNVRRRVPNSPQVRDVYAGQIRLPYHRIDRIWSHCLDGCQRAEVGFIPLSAASFEIAARTGLPLRVFGNRGRYEGVVPATLFQTVLSAPRTPDLYCATDCR
jgi:hypothetical protein